MQQILGQQFFNQMTTNVPEGYVSEIAEKLTEAKVVFTVIGTQLTLARTDEDILHQILSSVVLPNLAPVQFNWLITTAGLDQPIATLLATLQQSDVEKYAIFKAFLTSARYYEFNRVVEMMDQAKPVIMAVNPAIDLSLPTLKALWRQAQLI